MKRWITKLVLFLLLGAIVNVGVAWECVLLPFSYVVQKTLPLSESLLARELRLNNPSDVPLVEEAVSRSFGCLRLLSDTYWPHDDSADTGWRFYAGVCTIEAGWPFRVFDGEAQYIDGGTTYVHAVLWPPRREISYVGGDFLPVRPLWTGFLANVIFYAAILWLLSVTPYALRRFIRSKRGHCIECGYDLRGTEHEVCPECGQEHRARAKV
ncbi:MAG: hypothetical protein V3T53_05145 [Phycisphaerales bacterium]